MARRKFKIIKACKTGCPKKGNQRTVHYRTGEIVELDTDNPIVAKWYKAGNLKELKNENVLHDNKTTKGYNLK